MLIFDKTYQDRIALRESLIQQYPDDVVGVTNDSDDRVQGAVHELYSYLFTVYLPSRYPAIFRPSSDQNGSIISLENLVTKETIPTNPTKLSLRTGLETISRNIDEDFFILLPHKSGENSDSAEVVYVLEAYSACFPSGFQPREKLGKKLADIHGPVPGYKAKLQKSMDRFFARLESRKLVRRVNWSLTVDEELYSNFDKSTPAFEGTLKKLEVEDLDLEKVCHFFSKTCSMWLTWVSFRHSSVVSGRLFIVCQHLAQLSLLSTPTSILSKMSKRMEVERTLL